MKKLLLFVAVCCFTLASCNNKAPEAPQGQQQPCPQEQKDPQGCQMSEEQKTAMQDWKNWENLTDARKTELLNKRKECYDKQKAEEAEREANKAKFEAQMKNWDKLSVDEKKAAFDLVTPKCDKQGCCKEGQGCKGECKGNCKGECKGNCKEGQSCKSGQEAKCPNEGKCPSKK